MLRTLLKQKLIPAQMHPTGGIVALLSGHTDAVNAVKFLTSSDGCLLILSGSADKTLKLWRQLGSESKAPRFECVQTLQDHQSSINCIAVSAAAGLVATGSADAAVRIWKLNESVNDGPALQCLQTIPIKPRFFPLAIALSPLQAVTNSFILAVAGTSTSIQLYVCDPEESETPSFRLHATLGGHEGWIRSLAFTQESEKPESDLLLSSASQDKYIRLWRLRLGKELPNSATADPALGAFMPGRSLSNKAHRFRAGGQDYSATFEALLLGHDDWIYSTSWRLKGNALQLLSASADNSLSIWEPDPTSGVWVSVTRLGEISAQKGSTTATGSTGGFWTGLWSPSGETVVCLGRTGSWRLWNHDERQGRWVQYIGISGHTLPVTGIAWSKSGEYLLSTSSDQTTRLHAQWKHDGQTSWHELARPQIHGYDLNCIDTLGTTQFVSGADEKLLRVFKTPKTVASVLSQLCDINPPAGETEDLPDAANMPVLGLSNKAISTSEDTAQAPAQSDTALDSQEAVDPNAVLHKSEMDLTHPPLEDHLSRHTLFPEIEKLYGHGFEISCLAASHDGSVVATACKATGLDHAVIRLYETKGWTEVRPVLVAHHLTVTRLRFSDDDEFLLSVGRDRTWALFRREAGAEGKERLTYKAVEVKEKAHTRMILDAAWIPGTKRRFATAGRDKKVNIWREATEDAGAKFVCEKALVMDQTITAIDILAGAEERAYLAIGLESGSVEIRCISGAEVTGSLRPEPRYV